MNPISKFEIFYNPLKLQVDLFEKNSINSKGELDDLETLNNEVTRAVDQCYDDDTIDYDEKDLLSTSLCSLNERIENLIEKINLFAEAKPITTFDKFDKLYEMFNEKITDIETKVELKYQIFDDIFSDRFQLDKLEMKIESFKRKCLSSENLQEKLSPFNEFNSKINALKLKLNSLINENWKEELNINNFDKKKEISQNEARVKYDEKAFRLLLKLNNSEIPTKEDIDSGFEIAKSTPHRLLRNLRLVKVSEAYLKLNTEEDCKKSYKATKLTVFDPRNKRIFLNKIVNSPKPQKPSFTHELSYILESCLEVKTPYTIHLARKIFEQYPDSVSHNVKEKQALEALEKTLDVFYEENLYIQKFENSPKNKIFNTLWRGIYDNNSYMQNDPFPREIIGVIFEKCLQLNF